jgi:hypothetical protein
MLLIRRQFLRESLPEANQHRCSWYLPINIEKNEFSIIRIKQHVVADSGKKIGVVDFDLICEYNQQIGNPKPIDF